MKIYVKNDDGSFSEKQKEKMTKAIFSNEDILDQLREAKKNRDKDFLYYSGDEKEFEKLVDACYSALTGFTLQRFFGEHDTDPL